MEEHHIKVKIADRVYYQVIHSQEEEAVFRQAAQSVNRKITDLSMAYTGVTPIDILTIAALNESIERIELEQRLSGDESGLQKLSDDLQNYVDSIE